MGCLEDADCDPSFACVEFMCVSVGAIPSRRLNLKNPVTKMVQARSYPKILITPYQKAT